jgi:hypothetical protein
MSDSMYEVSLVVVIRVRASPWEGIVLGYPKDQMYTWCAQLLLPSQYGVSMSVGCHPVKNE